MLSLIVRSIDDIFIRPKPFNLDSYISNLDETMRSIIFKKWSNIVIQYWRINFVDL
jgi:hypothetical protein